MLKAIISVSSLVLGGGIFYVVLLLQNNRFAFTAMNGETASISTAIRALEPAPNVELTPLDAAAAELVSLPEMQVKGPSATRQNVATSTTVVPCSDWIELGPTAVATPKTSATRHVQLMCAKRTN